MGMGGGMGGGLFNPATRNPNQYWEAPQAYQYTDVGPGNIQNAGSTQDVHQDAQAQGQAQVLQHAQDLGPAMDIGHSSNDEFVMTSAPNQNGPAEWNAHSAGQEHVQMRSLQQEVPPPARRRIKINEELDAQTFMSHGN